MPVITCHSVAEIREKLHPLRNKNSMALVPTMGALHAGHAQLIREAKAHMGGEGTVVVSVFVNPTQFGPNEDFSRYPRTMEADLKLVEEAGGDLIFAPSVDQMYAPDHSIEVRETRLAEGLCGASRPGHFAGVCLVVLQLFQIVQPTIAVFGQKDYQQLAVIRRLVRDLHVPVEVLGVPTVREEDGLAMSSRNQNLSKAERSAAPAIYASLSAGKKRWSSHPDTEPALLTRFVKSKLDQIPGARVDYLELVDAHTLEPVVGPLAGPAVMATAVFLGSTRLIDNVTLGPGLEQTE